MQHDGSLWWWAWAVAAAAGGVLGHFCLLAARQYRVLMGAGHGADAACLGRALLAAGRAWPSSRIIVDATRGAWLAFLVPALAWPALIHQQGISLPALLLALAVLVLVLLACIDFYSGLLPDALTLPLLWLGLIASWAGQGPALHDSLAGVMLGYAVPGMTRAVWLRLRGVEGLGLGDVKLLSALGAWAGPAGVLDLLMLACLTGMLFAMVHQRRWRPAGAYPFGPFLALASLPVLVFPAFQSGTSWVTVMFS